MSTSGPPGRLLSPPPEITHQNSRRSNSSVGSRGSCSLTGSTQASVSRVGSPSEGLLTPSLLSAGLASPHYASDFGSEYMSNSDESTYLTPPQSQGDHEKPPYKPRSPSSASLNMSSSRATHGGHKHRAKKQRPRQTRKPPGESSNEHGEIFREHNSQLQHCLPGCQKTPPSENEADEGYQRVETFIKSIGGLKNTIRGPNDDLKSSSCQYLSKPAINITTRRWSSVAIGANPFPRRSFLETDRMGDEVFEANQKITHSWSDNHKSEEIMRVVRARLTFCEVSSSHPPTPATITLRRATKVPTEEIVNSNNETEIDAKAALLSQPGKEKDTRLPVSTYLITADDINFVTNLIKSGSEERIKMFGTPITKITAPRKPSVTSQGVVPQSRIPADVTTTIADVHKAPKIPRVSFQDSKKTGLKPVVSDMRKNSRAHSLQNVPEVIWEDTGSPCSQCTSSNTSSSIEGQDRLADNSSTAWLLRDSSSRFTEEGSQQAEPRGRYGSRSPDDRDCSPTSRVLQWVFTEPTEELVKGIGQLPKQSLPVERMEPPQLVMKKVSIPSISLFSPDVVSFPPLPARTCTGDWISPLPDMSAPASDDGKSLHDAGIDAQVGRGWKEPHTSLHHVDEQDSLARVTEQYGTAPSTDSDAKIRRQSATLLHPQVPARLGGPLKVGNALGCSSRVHRKSSTQSVRLKINEETLEHHLHEDQTVWVKARRDSGWPAPKSPSPEELASRKASSSVQLAPQQARAQPFNGLMPQGNRYDLLMGLTPLLLEADCPRIYAASN